MAATKQKQLPTYKGQPLVRSGNVLYYGDPTQPFVAMLQILSTREAFGMSLADKVSVQILSTDEAVHTSQRVVKRTEKNGLYNALSIAEIWLERALAK